MRRNTTKIGFSRVLLFLTYHASYNNYLKKRKACAYRHARKKAYASVIYSSNRSDKAYEGKSDKGELYNIHEGSVGYKGNEGAYSGCCSVLKRCASDMRVVIICVHNEIPFKNLLRLFLFKNQIGSYCGMFCVIKRLKFRIWNCCKHIIAPILEFVNTFFQKTEKNFEKLFTNRKTCAIIVP